MKDQAPKFAVGDRVACRLHDGEFVVVKFCESRSGMTRYFIGGNVGWHGWVLETSLGSIETKT